VDETIRAPVYGSITLIRVECGIAIKVIDLGFAFGNNIDLLAFGDHSKGTLKAVRSDSDMNIPITTD
jgi:hypothetical protein